VTTNVGNIAEMVGAWGDEPAALMLNDSDPPNPKEIAELLSQLKDDEALRTRLAQNGYARVIEKYSTDVVIPGFERILHAIHSREDVLSISEAFFTQKY
jgi:glycosyltransferase involved in cell wall biosynthesis